MILLFVSDPTRYFFIVIGASECGRKYHVIFIMKYCIKIEFSTDLFLFKLISIKTCYVKITGKTTKFQIYNFTCHMEFISPLNTFFMSCFISSSWVVMLTYVNVCPYVLKNRTYFLQGS
jgi:hypothetical protein